jgi:hypothetical protein
MKKLAYAAILIVGFMFAAHSDFLELQAQGAISPEATVLVADSGVAMEAASTATTALPAPPIGGDMGQWVAWILTALAWVAGIAMAYMYKKANAAKTKLVDANRNMAKQVGKIESDLLRLSAQNVDLTNSNKAVMETLGKHQQEHNSIVGSLKAENLRLKTAYDGAVKNIAKNSVQVEEGINMPVAVVRGRRRKS